MYRLVVVFCLVAVLSCGAVIPPVIKRLIRRNGRIVGGIDAEISEVPYQVALEWDGYQFCAASIITDTFAISAGHCVDGWDARELSIRIGSSRRESGGTLIKVQELIPNPRYNNSNVDYDVSLIRFASSIQFNLNVQPIVLADVEPSPGENVTVSGWGILQEGGFSSNQLQLVKIPIVDKIQCNKFYSRFGGITDRMICAGRSGQDSCKGDSGGPVALDDKIVGVVSWGYGCAREDYPGVYANIANPEIRQFIRDYANI